MCYFFMRKKILSTYLAVAILFLSVATSAVPVYASNSTNWEDYFSITYTATNTNSPYSLDFKSTTAESAYKKLSKDERKKIDYDAFMAISAKDQNHKFGNLVFNNTTIPDLIKGIAGSAGMVMSGKPDDTGFNADLQDKLTRISNSISASNRKFGGGGMSFASSSTNPSNFGLGKITLTKNFINELRSNVAEFDNYYIYPALPSDPSHYKTLLGSVLTTSQNNTLNKYLVTNSANNYAVLKFSNCLEFYTFYTTSSSESSVFYYNSGSLRQIILSNGNIKTTYANMPLQFRLYSNTLYNYGGSDSFTIQFSDFMGRTNLYTKVFKSYADAENYIKILNGYSTTNYYISNTIVNNDYSTTINKIYDYSSNDTYTTINNNITQAIHDAGTSGITDEQYQKIVDEVMQKVQQEIDSKPDTSDSGSSGGGSTGGDSGNTGGGSSGGSSGGSGADSGENDTWLEKIYNRLGDILEKIGTVTGIETILEYLKQIAADLSTLKEGGMLSADMTDTNGLLKDIKKLLGTLIAVQAVGDIADLLADTVGDKINDYVDDLKAGVTEVADALQDVFPFSIPWDLMAILALFSAEAQAPVFDIPVNIPQIGVQHSIHVDLSEFESISVICRAFLSLSFAVGLMYLTIRITGGKDDD